jgi:hypothetical protein
MKRSLNSETNLGGRTSRKDALNQLRGNLKRSLEVFDPWEIIVVVLKLERNRISNTNKSSPEKRLEFMEKLRWYHIKSLNTVNKEIKRTKRYVESSDQNELEKNLSHKGFL